MNSGCEAEEMNICDTVLRCPERVTRQYMIYALCIVVFERIAGLLAVDAFECSARIGGLSAHFCQLEAAILRILGDQSINRRRNEPFPAHVQDCATETPFDLVYEARP